MEAGWIIDFHWDSGEQRDFLWRFMANQHFTFMSEGVDEVANDSHWDGTYNALSDIRFKEDVTDIEDEESKRILIRKPRKYVMLNDPPKKLQY